jgi:hypothetical protein
MADLAQDKLIGRSTASTGVPQAVACTAAGRALIDDADAAAQLTTLGIPTPFAGINGGTGVNNGANTITVGGNFAVSGAFTCTLTVTGNTGVTLPTAGTLATLAGAEKLSGKTIQGGNFGTDAGSTDDYAFNASPALTAYVAGQFFLFIAATSNTTGATLNVNSLGAKAIVKRASTALATGDIVTGMRCFVVYDGTNFILINPVVN